MKKRVILGLFLIFFLFPLVSASLSDEIQKITHHAEEYETGNINYVQLLVYTSAVRESINEILGSTEREFGGILEREQLAPLGEPTKDTKWVWVENEEHEVRVDEPLPVWRNVIFDGKKIQIRMNAWPSIFRKEGEERLFYRLHFEINFKKPEEQITP
jgi:hypothetical protein